ncbi:hypothetical protein L198_04400 [Cryptococcus wingfieldii CBS 7118]|uniref:RING-type domain-containing protein n=2 Tax=Cryptococcus TaxID=5206 RepID=A0A1E3J4K6_9TREE|nr:hypothetical protein L198_04400 [Cryptococcus wingfieldii CBS 7118]ODN95782.1 hypothetical protein L198_04400 [Cryptococcus wingfieldii CBS 7118]TYJ53659.1 hypothetical protein B9479_005685 [Cryptococcus floricola]
MVFRHVWGWMSSPRKPNLNLTPTSTNSSTSSQQSSRSGRLDEQAATTAAYIVCPRPLPSRAFSDEADTECPICLDEMELVIFAPQPSELRGKIRSLRKKQTYQQAVETPVDPALHTSKGHVVAPCGHVYHYRCLKGWLEIKPLCPLCQDKLPTLSLPAP